MSDNNKTSVGDVVLMFAIGAAIISIAFVATAAVVATAKWSIDTFKDLSSKGKVAFVACFAAITGTPMAGYKIQEHLKDQLATEAFSRFANIERAALQNKPINENISNCLKSSASRAYAEAIRTGIFVIPHGKATLDDTWEVNKKYKASLHLSRCLDMDDGKNSAAYTNAAALSNTFKNQINIRPVGATAEKLLADDNSTDFAIDLKPE